MITKVTRGDRIQGLVWYLFGPGRHEEHRDPHLVASWEGVAGEGRLTKSEQHTLAQELDSPRRIHDVRPAGYVWQCALRNHAEDRVLSDEEWGDIARQTIAAVGFDDCRWIAVRHADDHIHLAVNRVQEDGRVAPNSNDFHKLRAVARRFELDFGLERRTAARGSGMPGLARAEQEIAARDQQQPRRPALERKIRAAAASSRHEAEFVDRARAEGLLVRPRWSGENAEVPTIEGYSVAQAGGLGDDGLVWYGGGSLARDLTLPRLRQRWGERDETAARAAWKSDAEPAKPGTLRAEAWTQASAVVDDVRQRLAAIPLEDEPAWRAAAGEAAGAVSALALQLEPSGQGPLVRAATSLTAAAQTPAAQAQALPSALQTIWSVTRTARDATIAGRGGLAGAAVLTRSLLGLVQQIGARDAQEGHAVEATRSAVAGESLLQWLSDVQRTAPTGRTSAERPPTERTPETSKPRRPQRRGPDRGRRETGQERG